MCYDDYLRTGYILSYRSLIRPTQKYYNNDDKNKTTAVQLFYMTKRRLMINLMNLLNDVSVFPE